MADVFFVDTTLRDGHASLWAEGMTTGMMVPVAAQLDRAGFVSAELMGTSHFLKCIRELREDPWERVRLVAKAMPNTPLTLMMQHSIRTFDFTPFSVMRLWMERVAANGIRRVQIMNASNNMGFKVPELAGYAKEVGLEVIIALTYSFSPRHTDEYYARVTREASKLPIDGVYLKDPGGLLTPDRMPTLVPAILENATGLKVEIHSHCTTGLAPLCYLEAIRLGIPTVHTAVPPLANGSAQPSVLNIARNARVLGHTPRIDEAAIEPVANHFRFIARRSGLPLGTPVEYDVDQYIHQVPGGVISNLRHQLSVIRMSERLDEVLAETVRVRQDLGYPIMVTPFSQLVVSQAAMNVMAGERYGRISDEVIKYALGFWGKEDGLAIDPDVRDQILGHPRAKELARMEPPQPTLEEVRREMGATGIDDDEFLLRYIVREEKEIRALREAAPSPPHSFLKNPTMALIQELAKIRDRSRIFVQKGDVSITLQKNPQG